MKKIFALLFLVTLTLCCVEDASAQYRGKRNSRLDEDYRTSQGKGKKNRSAVVAAPAESAAEETPAVGYNPEPPPINYLFAADELNIAVILPFNLASTSVAEDKNQMRSVEFYQGLLLAVNQAQAEGMKVVVQTYDLGTRSLEDILADDNLRKARVIVAPMKADQVQTVATFGERYGIEVISPFTYNAEMNEVAQHLYQLNTPKATIYEQLNEAVMDYFRNYQIVFVKDSLFMNKLDPYPAELKAALDRNHITYQNYIYNDPYSVVCMDSALHLGDKHVLYVLETPQQDALRRFFPSMKNKQFLDANPAMASAIGASYASGSNMTSSSVTIESMIPDSLYESSVSVFSEERKVAILGYPEWQLYTNDFMEYFYDLNVWMFTKFYVNPFELEVQNFYNDFKFWYNRELMQIYPKYGLMGYDVATYVLNRLHLYGTLAEAEGDAPIRTLQSAVRFVRNGNGCYLNRGLYLVHFTPETTIEKIEIK